MQIAPKQAHFLTTDIEYELAACLAGRTFSLLPAVVCRPYIEQGALQAMFPDLQIVAWTLYLYRPYQTVTSVRVLKVFDLLTGILKARFGK